MVRPLRKLSHIGLISNEVFYSKLKGNIMRDDYNQFVQDFNERGCITMMDWLKVYDKAKVNRFKTRKQNFPDETNMLKDVVSIPSIFMTHTLKKSFKMKQPSESQLFAPG